MRTLSTRCICTWSAIILCSNLHAESVTDWHTFKNTATTLSGQGTDDPIMGSIENPSSTAFLIGYLNSPLSLANVGDKISLTFSVSFNDAIGMGTGGDNFRFALFDLNNEAKVTADNTATAGTTDTDNFRGYWFGVRSGSGTGSGGSIRERTADSTNPFSGTGTTLLGNPTGEQMAWVSAINGVGGALFSGELTLTLTGAGVDLSGSFSGNGTQNTFAYSDTSSPFLTFGAVGFLNGNGISADQVLFQDITVAYIPVVPEPASWSLLFIGALICFFRKRV